jgi:hypothetical protein
VRAALECTRMVHRNNRPERRVMGMSDEKYYESIIYRLALLMAWISLKNKRS